MAAESISGACLCGNVTFKLSGNPDKVLACYCTDCQKNAGGLYQVVRRVVFVMDLRHFLQRLTDKYSVLHTDGSLSEGPNQNPRPSGLHQDLYHQKWDTKWLTQGQTLLCQLRMHPMDSAGEVQWRDSDGPDQSY